MIVNASAMFIMQKSTRSINGGQLDDIQKYGASIWFAGFFMETVADRQLQVHRDNPQKKGTICKKGFWRVSRHPNYFGEAL